MRVGVANVLGVSVTDIRRHPTADYAMAQGPTNSSSRSSNPTPTPSHPNSTSTSEESQTVITVNTTKGRLSLEQRRRLAETLTDAVLVPEVGQHAPAARPGFQVHFVERAPDMMAIGGRLLADAQPQPDVMLIDVAVMDADWRQDVRTQVIERPLAAMAHACGLDKPSPAWWGQLPRHRRGKLGIQWRRALHPLPPRQRRVHRRKDQGDPRGEGGMRSSSVDDASSRPRGDRSRVHARRAPNSAVDYQATAP
jgi:phenylpyruvate tautomerase PptA (4-oxalocrotonate tautomerase family)